MAAAVTGKTAPDDALAALRADPALLERFLAGMKEHEEAWWAEATARLRDVQTTMRAETASEDPFVRRMRPAWGYSMCLAFTTQMLGVTWNIFFRPGEVPAIVAALADLTMIWSVGMSVLGLYVWKRSSEKGVAGFDPLALLKRR